MCAISSSFFHATIGKFYTWLFFLHNQRLWWLWQIWSMTVSGATMFLFLLFIVNWTKHEFVTQIYWKKFFFELWTLIPHRRCTSSFSPILSNPGQFYTIPCPHSSYPSLHIKSSDLLSQVHTISFSDFHL